MQGVWTPGRSRAHLAALLIAFGALAFPAGSAAFVKSGVAGSELRATSDSGSDIIKVSCGIDLMVKVNGLDPTAGPAPCASIRGVLVVGGAGADTINVSRVGPRNGFTNLDLRVGLSIAAYGGDSADRISGSRLSDLLAGGNGNDILRGRSGSDFLKGGSGSDRLIGGAGADRLRGGRGRDRLEGGHGADTLLGGRGDDVELSP